MSELDLIFSRKKKEEIKKEEKKETKIEDQKIETINTEEKKENEENSNKVEDQKVQQSNNIEDLMKKFIEKDPKIGVWSYPAYLLLQYLYNTIPGFKMSKTAKDALERGLREMYPELYQIAEKVAKDFRKI